MPKISVITPTYNGSSFIKRAIQSVINQTFTDWELLIVDDCSKDDTVELVSEFAKQDKRIKLSKTSKNSGGPATPKNIGIKNAIGEYVAFLDHDDEWLPEKLKKQLKVFEESKDDRLGVVSCGANLINNKGKCFSIYKPTKRKITFPEILIRNPIYSNSSVLMKRNLIDIIGQRDEVMKYSEDWDTWINVCKAGYNIDFVYESLFNYYFHDSNTTKILKDKLAKAKDALYVFIKYQDLYNKYNYIHIGYFRLGVMYFLGEDVKNSRLYFLESIKHKRLFIPAYFGYIFSFLGGLGILIINFIIFLYRIMHGKIYLIKTKKNILE
jgi:glycosyltransferase involved in cell wall biosynthesis